MHQFLLPSGKASHVVKRIYEVEIPHSSTFEENRIIPIGTGTITFTLKGNIRFKHEGGIITGLETVLSGQYFPTFSFACDTALLFCGIALKPTATYKLFDIYLAELHNEFIDLSDIIGAKAEDTYQKLQQANATKTRLNILNRFMHHLMPDEITHNHLDVMVDYIYLKKGNLKVKDLCNKVNVSRRYIEKKFKKIIGFTPGQFIRQVRFNFTCAALAKGELPVNDILAQFGYYDRSHFMKKFKKYHSNDLSVLTGKKDTLFSTIFSRIMRSDEENSFHP